MPILLLASYSDVENRYEGTMPDQTKVETKLEDASAMLLSLMGNRYDESDELQAANLKRVCADMVIRTFSSDELGRGVTQHSMTASSFNESFTYANPTGDLYLTSQEKKLLGIGASRVYVIEPSIRPNYGLRSSIDPDAT